MDNTVQFSTIADMFGPGGIRKAMPLLRPHVGMKHNAAMRHNALLRKDEWLEIDRVVLETAKTELNAVQDLISQGLTKTLGGLGSKVSAYEKVSEMTAANVSMSVDVPGDRDRLEYEQVNVPIPVIYKDFQFDLRDLQSARQSGDPLETDHITAATRVVTEAMESMVVTGHAKQLGGYVIEGYTDATYRLTDTAANYGGGDFGTAGNFYKTIVGVLTALRAIGFRGPFMVYIASTQYGQTLNLIDTTSGRPEIAVVRDNIPEIRDIKPSFNLTDGHMVVVQMTPNVVDLAVGMALAPIQWTEMGGMITDFRIMTALAPRVKRDANNHTGVCHVTSC